MNSRSRRDIPTPPNAFTRYRKLPLPALIASPLGMLKHRMKLECVSGLSQYALLIDVAAKVLAAVGLWRLYSGHWRRDFLINRMAGSGRLRLPSRPAR